MRLKLLVWILAFVVFASCASATIYKEDFFAYYDFDDNDFNDSTSNYGVVVNAGTTNASKLVPSSLAGSARYCDGTDSMALFNVSSKIKAQYNGWTVRFWVNGTDFTANRNVMMHGVAGSYLIFLYYQTTGKLHSWLNSSHYDNFVPTNGAIYHVVMTSNGTNMTTWVNGTQWGSVADAGNIDANSTIHFCQWSDGSEKWIGTIDELAFSNKTWTSAEISADYAAGNGRTYTSYTPAPTQSINISNLSPAANESFNVTTVQFNASVNSSTNFNCTIYLNGTVNQSYYNYASGTDVFVGFNVTFPSLERSYLWMIGCNNSDNYANSSNRTVYIDTSLPSISNNFNHSVKTDVSNFTGFINYTDAYLYSYNITFDANNIANRTNIASTVFTYNISTRLNGNTTGEHYIWTKVCDGHTNNTISSWNYSLTSDTITFKNKFKLQAIGANKVTLQKTFDRYTPKFEYSTNTSQKVYVLESDYIIEKTNRDDYKGWFVIPGIEKWIDFEEGTGGEVTYRKISNKKWEITVNNPSKVIEYNSFGELNCLSQNLTFFYANVTYHANETTVSSNQPVYYEMNITFNSSWMTNITAVLNYNNTNHTATVSNTSTQYSFSATVNSANITSINENTTAFWYFAIDNGTVNVTGVTSNHTLYGWRPLVSWCNSTYSMMALQFFIYNETNSSTSLVNATSEVSIDYYEDISSGIIYNFNYTFVGNNSPSICIYTNGTNFSADIHVDYHTNDSATPFFSYFTIGTILDNVTNNVSLYMMDGTTQVSFYVVDQTDTDVPNVLIKVLKYDVGTNNYFTTQVLKTDSSGLAYGQIVLSTEWYKFILEYDGEIVLETVPTLIASTSKTFRITLGSDYFANYDVYMGIVHSLAFSNTTKNFVLTWTDPSGLMDTMCLKIIKSTNYANTLINSSCVTSTAGTIILNIGSNASVADNDYEATAYVLFDDIMPIDFYTVSFDDLYLKFGDSGILFTFLLVGFLVFVGAWSPVISLGLMAIAFVMVNILQIFYIPAMYFVMIIVLIILALFSLRRQ